MGEIQEDFLQEAALDLHLSLTEEGRIFFLVTNSSVFGIKKEVMLMVENLESVEECKEKRNKNQLLLSSNKPLPPSVFLLCFC